MAFFSFVVAAFSVASIASALPEQSQARANSAYDYVIVGGGTSGLVVANRLSENPNITVAVIEVGDSILSNTNVSSASGYGKAFGTPIDYAFQTVEQAAAGGNVQTMRAGKAIGGTSTINGMAYTRAQNSQIDNWEELGSAGWNWNSLFPYYVKSESIEAPNADQQSKGAAYAPAYHGTTGPVKVGWSAKMALATAEQAVATTLKNLNVSTFADVNGGEMNGFNVYPKTIDSAAGLRWDASRAYYWPFINRTNLHLYGNTTAQRIIWSPDTSNGAKASGVLVKPASGSAYTITATKEVILSAGSLRTPLLLEYSGIGNPSILSSLGIKTVVNLPTVGENLQDQTNTAIVAKPLKSISGSEGYVVYPTAAQVFGSSYSSIKAELLANLTAYAEATSAASKNVTKAADLMNFFKMQCDLIFDGKTPMAELIITTSETIDIESWTLLPFSRGSIHITSKDTTVPGAINPNYYALEWDIRSQVAVLKYMRTIISTSPLSASVGVETSPSKDTVPANASEATWFNWMQRAYRSNYHPVGTAAMMPREVGGVVDAGLKVYGTANVRVVDASVLPFQVCGHLVSTLYAVAERVSDLIKSET